MLRTSADQDEPARERFYRYFKDIADLAHDNHVPVAVDTLQLDQNLAPAALDESLTRLEQTARLNGRAIAMAPPVPVVIERLQTWIKQLARDGIVLAPLTAMVQ